MCVLRQRQHGGCCCSATRMLFTRRALRAVWCARADSALVLGEMAWGPRCLRWAAMAAAPATA